MDIHVVRSGETIEEIAERYGVSVQRIIQDNELRNPRKLVTGEAIIISYPVSTYIVQEGDTLLEIADMFNISVLQLLQNNPFLSDRNYIYPGEGLVISYNNTMGKMMVGGFAYPYIEKKILVKTLPYLTNLTIFNYTLTSDGEVISYYDDTELIQACKSYGVAPLMLLTTLTTKGEPNIEAAYDILSQEDIVDKYVDIILNLVETKGYYGINVSFQYLNTTNEMLYLSLLKKISIKSYELGYPLFVTINPNKTIIENRILYEQVDYSGYNDLVENITFLNYQFGYNFGPPTPVASIEDIQIMLDYVLNYISPQKTSIGIPTIGYDWELPYVVGFSKATSISLDAALDIARDVGAVIEFDEPSKTPFLRYTEEITGIHHIVWFIDARTFNSLMDVVVGRKLKGTGIWNVMKYNQQIWTVINTQYEIEKIYF